MSPLHHCHQWQHSDRSNCCDSGDGSEDGDVMTATTVRQGGDSGREDVVAVEQMGDCWYHYHHYYHCHYGHLWQWTVVTVVTMVSGDSGHSGDSGDYYDHCHNLLSPPSPLLLLSRGHNHHCHHHTVTTVATVTTPAVPTVNTVTTVTMSPLSSCCHSHHILTTTVSLDTATLVSICFFLLVSLESLRFQRRYGIYLAACQICEFLFLWQLDYFISTTLVNWWNHWMVAQSLQTQYLYVLLFSRWVSNSVYQMMVDTRLRTFPKIGIYWSVILRFFKNKFSFFLQRRPLLCISVCACDYLCVLGSVGVSPCVSDCLARVFVAKRQEIKIHYVPMTYSSFWSERGKHSHSPIGSAEPPTPQWKLQFFAQWMSCSVIEVSQNFWREIGTGPAKKISCLSLIEISIVRWID
jgi:hypothetical protein